MKKISYTITSSGLNMVLKGRPVSLSKTSLVYPDVVEYIKGNDEHDEDVLLDMMDSSKKLGDISDGNVTIKDDQVFYKGVFVENVLTEKLLGLIEEGFDATPWVKFLDKLMENVGPSRDSLFNLLEHHNTPITPDGNFIAFKRVRSDFRDIHSGTFDNSPGKVVKIDRSKVDADSNRTCSHGLHACASEYLGSFYASCDGYKVVMLEVDPRNVVAVPADYSFSKMRVCEYKVLCEVQPEDIERIDSQYGYSYDMYDEEYRESLDDSWDYEDSDYYIV